MALSPTTTYKIGAPLSLCSSYSCPRSHWALVSVFHLFHPAPCAHVVREGLPYGPCPQRSQITKVISFRSLQEAVIRHHRCRSYAMAKLCSLSSQSTTRARAGGRVGTTPCSLLCYTSLPLLPLLPLLLLLLLIAATSSYRGEYCTASAGNIHVSYICHIHASFTHIG